MAKSSAQKFYIKICLLGATTKVKISDKENYVYSGYGIISDGGGSWRFGKNFASNVIIFGFENSSSSHSDNRKNKFLILGEDITYGINIFGSPEKMFSINCTKSNTTFCLSLN